MVAAQHDRGVECDWCGKKDIDEVFYCVWHADYGVYRECSECAVGCLIQKMALNDLEGGNGVDAQTC